MKTLADNEAVYDARIAPLMTQIIAICKEHEIPMCATFEYAPGGYCTSVVPADGASDDMRHLVNTMYRFAQTGRTTPLVQITTTRADGSKTLEVIVP